MRRRAAVTLALALASCAAPLRERRAGDADARDGWRALEEGRPAEAARAFEARLAVAPDDVLARLGSATLAYEHGDGAQALDDYAAVLAASARARGRDGLEALLASVAAARALVLDDDVAPRRRARDEAALLALPDGDALPWQARLDLARLAERVARRAGDAAALEREVVQRGCARDVFDAGALGPLAHLDLDRAVATPPAAAWTPVLASGCHLSTSARDGQPAAERLRADVDVPAGVYDLVLDYDGDARVALDGAAPLRHGSDTRFGPRVSAFAFTLAAGRHEIELGLATLGGRSDVSLLLLPRDAAARVRFVDPRGALGDTRAGRPRRAAALQRFGGARRGARRLLPRLRRRSGGRRRRGPHGRGPPRRATRLRARPRARRDDLARRPDAARGLHARHGPRPPAGRARRRRRRGP